MIEILDAVVWALREGPKCLTNPPCNKLNCNVEPEGHPPPRAPEVYLSVDESSVNTNGLLAQIDLTEKHSINVFISLRLGIRPIDRYDELYRRNKQGLEAIERQVLRAIHGQQAVRQKASELVAVTQAAVPFTRPLYYMGRQRTEIRGPEWSHEEDQEGAPAVGWLVRRLTFVGMDRIQHQDFL